MVQGEKKKVCLVCGHDHKDFSELNPEQLEQSEANHIEYDMEREKDYVGP